MSKTSRHGTQSGAQSIEELQRRYQKLDQERVRAEANHENAEKRLAELKAEAKDTYGTDDVEELKAKLEELKAENERKRTEYQAHLDSIESDLQKVESRFQEEEA